MKVTLSVKLESGMHLGVNHNLETFSDVPKLCAKLTAMVAGAKKLIPGVGEQKVTGVHIAKE